MLTILTGTQQYAYILKQRIIPSTASLSNLSSDGLCVPYVHTTRDKAMVMTLHMTVVKQHSQHIMTPTITIYMPVVKQLTLTTKHKTV
jgi:hypothetical protein